MSEQIRKWLLSIICILIVFSSVDLFYKTCNFGAPMIFFNLKSTILTFVLLLMIYLILWGLTKKSNRALIILSILLFLFTVANQIKIAYTDEPILFSDILFLNNAGELTDIVGSTIAKFFMKDIKYTLTYALILILIGWISTKNSITVKNKPDRTIMIVIPFIILIIMFFPSEGLTKFMLNSVFDFNYRKDYTRWGSKDIEYLVYGVLPGMYCDALENRLLEPEDYDETIIKEQLENVNDKEDSSFGTPNIIVVFAESFFDIDELDEITYNKEITKNFNQLKNEGIFVNMVSPSYGGVSSNIEFEFLTGANVMYFNNGYIPSMQLYRNDSYYNRPSIIKELNNNGYRTKIVNYTPDKSFRVGEFYKYLGVKETEFNTNIDKKNLRGNYVSDEYVIDKAIEELANKQSSEKLFYMTLSMQSHMPYLKSKYKNYDIHITKSNLTDDMNEVILSYAQGIYDMDQQLGRLYEYIQNYDEPTIIVFYGDHLPYLRTTEGIDILNHLKYFNTGNEMLDYYRKYNTQALILANYNISDEETKYLGPDLLGCYIINRMDISISNYYIWLYNNNSITCANWYILLDSEGNMYYTNKLPNKLQEAYDLRKNIQYYLFVK